MKSKSMTTQAFDQYQDITDTELQGANGGIFSIGLCTAMTIARGVGRACYWAERGGQLMNWGPKLQPLGQSPRQALMPTQK